MTFVLDNGDEVVFYHASDCCEEVTIDDIVGDLSDLVGSPILKAEEVTHDNCELASKDGYENSWTWTFYKFATAKGYVDVKWYGTSNGYYSESVKYMVNGKTRWD